jgi:hypothetical protein
MQQQLLVAPSAQPASRLMRVLLLLGQLLHHCSQQGLLVG